jgi:hypothetical protein
LAFREEVLNVKLAELLSQDGIISVPETIIKQGKSRRLPDVIVGDYLGTRIVIEGRTDGSTIKESLDEDCERRLEEGIAALIMGVVYPTQLRNSEFAKLDENMRNAEMQLKVYTEAGHIGWLVSDFSGLSSTLRTAYEALVREDVVNEAVMELSDSIEDASSRLSSPGTEERLRELLVVPSGEEEIDEDVE